MTLTICGTAQPAPFGRTCGGALGLGTTIGIVTNLRSGAREQSLVEARMAIVKNGSTIGFLYVDDEGQRYKQPRFNPNEMVRPRPIPGDKLFGGDERLEACT